jgi:hypothetical protein
MAITSITHYPTNTHYDYNHYYKTGSITTATTSSFYPYDVIKNVQKEEKMIEDEYPDEMTVQATQTINGWVGQLCWGSEVIWQSKKGRRDTEKNKELVTGSERAMQDARNHRRAVLKKLYNS